MNNDKWLMFKNYMHNELGITKDDIHLWIRESVQEEAKRLVAQEYGRFSIKDYLNNLILTTPDWFDRDRTFKKEFKELISQDIGKRIFDKLDINKKD